uniref:Uncharacterized protein n=1 Tax=Hyaloperonospora arabidopsidis (strain Emoy2) TaxID=559515 RepID=M4BR66_HYAAE
MQIVVHQCFAAATAQEASRKSSGRTYREATKTTATVPALQDGYFNFLWFGDSITDKNALFGVVESVCGTFVKALKFVEHPNAEEVLQQVELTFDSFEQLCGWKNNLDFRLFREKLAKMCGLHVQGRAGQQPVGCGGA